MNLLGDPDPLYVLSRRVLLDVLEKLGDQRDAVVLVGAQAIYLHAGDADFAVAEYTTDADLLVDPRRLLNEPKLEQAMSAAGLELDEQPGIWVARQQLEAPPEKVSVDLLVPSVFAMKRGQRAARLPGHADRVARIVRGIEAALVDNDMSEVGSLDPSDARRFRIRVAGPSALLVAKVHKVLERVDNPRRLEDKDALDVLRLLQAVPTGEFVRRLLVLRKDPISSGTTLSALGSLERLFGTPGSPGSQMAARAGRPAPEDVTAASISALVTDLLAATQVGR